MRSPWVCQACHRNLQGAIRQQCRRNLSSAAVRRQQINNQSPPNERLKYTRNIGIIAHIDAGKTTTTERMLYYSGFTRRIGDVDDGSTVTDFLPAERARGITIQSAAITFHWPPKPKSTDDASKDIRQYTINLIDTPGHADFTFEVIRSLRVLDGAICILDGVAGVEAQTEKVWRQANNYRIPRIIYVNKLDRDGAAFNRTVKEVASRLHTWPALCEIPWWQEGRFVGVCDVVNLRGLLWEANSDGSNFKTFNFDELQHSNPQMAKELLKARVALIEALTEQDEDIVETFFEVNEKYEDIPPEAIWTSLRKCLLAKDQAITPVFAGASFRNIGVQPLLGAVNDLLPSPEEIPDPHLSLGTRTGTMRKLLVGQLEGEETTVAKRRQTASSAKSSGPSADKLSACALAFKVVSDPKRGVLVYVRVYSGVINRNALLYNTNLAIAERAPRLLRMYASEAVEIDSIEEGQIGVIPGLKHARTGDTLIVYAGTSSKHPPPHPIDTLQLQPIVVPPPVFFTSVEPNSLSEEKNLEDALALLLREDPSLHVSEDAESGQTHLSGMGELHLEIAQGRLIDDMKVKATMGKIQIGYREVIQADTANTTRKFDRDVAGKRSEASCTAAVGPIDATTASPTTSEYVHELALHDSNRLTIRHPTISSITGKAISAEHTSLPAYLSLPSILQALQTGVNAALARGPVHRFAVHSTHVTLTFDPAQHLATTTTPAALSSAARMAVQAAMEESAAKTPTAMMEPVMLATVSVNEEALGSVVHDLSSARGGQVLSLDAEEENSESGSSVSTSSSLTTREQPERLSVDQLKRVYAPPDPFGSGEGQDSIMALQGQQRQIQARVPLKELVGYLKHLRSLTGGRGTFVMSVDRFEKMTPQRVKNALAEMSGDLA